MKQTIKILLFAFSLLFSIEAAKAQVPQLFNYQGIARDAKGNPLSNQKMSIKLAVLPAADATVPEYEETQIVSTNEFGLYTLQIGNGTAVSGEMKTVKWETGNKYIKVAIDPAGGTNYTDAGTNQLLSVPYAIYADKAGVAASGGNDKTRSGAVSTSAAGTGTVNYLTKFTAPNTIYNSQVFDNGTSIGIGTAAPSALAKIHMLTTAGNIEHIRMQNTNATGHGKFIMYNDVAGNYATFTKYGSLFPGGYPGIGSMFPYANMLAFGNNLGPFLLANNGNVGIGIVTGGTTKLYLNAQQNTGYLGLGGSFLPAANVHIGNTSTGDTLRITNSTTGHTNADGLEIGNTGNAAWMMNKENSALTLGTNNVGKVYISNNAKHMVGIGSTPSNNLSVYSGGFSDTVGIALNNGNDYFNISENVNGNIVFGANALTLGSSTPILTMDDDGINGVGIGTTTPLAKLHVTTTLDTAGFFESSSGNYVGGVVTGEYTGSSIIDHIGVTGYSLPDPSIFYGIGVRGTGGYYGVQGVSTITGSNNTGVMGTATSNGNAYGMQAHASAYNFNSPSNNKIGLLAGATGGANNYGVYATLSGTQSGNAYGVYANGKQTGVYGEADSASMMQSDRGVLYSFNEAVGVFGRGNSTITSSGYKNIGVLGNSSVPNAYWNIGVNAEASGGSFNTALLAQSPVGVSNYAGYFDGNVTVLGTLSKSGGTFKIDHPVDPANKYLIHSFVESPDMMNVYNGNTVSDANGFATVTLPSYFQAENKDFKYQLTVVDNSADFVMAKVTKEVANNTFEIRTSKPGVKVSWQVTGVRQDAWANANRVVDEVEKAPADKGYYLNPELFGAPATQRIGPKGSSSLPKNIMPSAAEHQKHLDEKARIDQEKLQKEQEAKKSWKNNVPKPVQDAR